MYEYGMTVNGRKPVTLPQLGQGEIYMTRQGQVFHDSLCQAVMRVMWQNPDSLVIRPAGDAGRRRLCTSCRASDTAEG